MIPEAGPTQLEHDSEESAYRVLSNTLEQTVWT